MGEVAVEDDGHSGCLIFMANERSAKTRAISADFLNF
jgi:hypothetical protein